MSVFYVPSTNLIGRGCINEIGSYINDLGYKKALLVTDDFLYNSDIFTKVKSILDKENVKYVVYKDVAQNPRVDNVNEGLERLKKDQCDFIISLGGGSSQDCANGIGILATNGGKIEDYEGLHKSSKRSLPIIAINTTAGTSAEVTINYVITDTKRKVKMVMVDKNSLATITVNDPELMTSKPKNLTAATGMDALTHALESLVTPGSYPVTEKLAKGAIELIVKYLPIAVENGEDIDAREAMVNAIFLGGMAFNNAGLGYVHSMAHQLGAVYNLPHGVCCAMLLPIVEDRNAQRVPAKFRLVAEAFGYNVESMTDEECALKVVEDIKALSKRVGIPSKLTEFGVKKEDFDFEMLSKNAMIDACAPGNPFVPTFEETVEMYGELF